VRVGAGTAQCGGDGSVRVTGGRVVVADAQPLFRVGARVAARASGKLDLVGEAGDTEALLRVIAHEDAQVAVVGTNVPPMPGAGRVTGLGAAIAVRQRFPNVAVVVVAQHPREAELFDALRLGAAAYLGRSIEPEALADVLVRVAGGAFVFDASVVNHRAQAPGAPPPPAACENDGRDGSEGVSSREREVLSLVGRGRSNREIGEALQISDQTVKNHVTALLRKLGVSDRTQAVVEAIRLGLIQP